MGNEKVRQFVSTVVDDNLPSLLGTPLATETSSNQSRKSRVTDMQRVESGGLGYLKSHTQRLQNKTGVRISVDHA